MYNTDSRNKSNKFISNYNTNQQITRCQTNIDDHEELFTSQTSKLYIKNKNGLKSKASLYSFLVIDRNQEK